MTREGRAVAQLIELKRDGYTFEEARRVVAYTARGPEAPRLFTLDGEDREEESLEDAFWRFCEDAWHGRRPGLRQFSVDVLRPVDGARAARPTGRIRMMV